MPTIFEILGLRFFFFSNEHEPIHVHVVKGEDNAKIAIVPTIQVVYNHGLKARDLRRAVMLAEEYKDDIIEKWYEWQNN